jgi:hypothetical protein
MFDQGQDARRAARTPDDRQRRGDQDGAARRQPVEIAQLGQAVLVRAEQVGVAGERRVEPMGAAGVRTDRLDADSDDRCLLGQPARTLRFDAGGVRAGHVGVQERVLVRGAGVPAGPVQQPAAVGQRAVVLLPFPYVLDGQQEVGVGGGLEGRVQDHGGGHEPARLDLGDVLAVPAGDPVDRCVEVGSGVLAGDDVVPVPRRTAVVIAADLAQREVHGVGERLGQLQDRRGLGQRSGEVDHLDRAVRERGGQLSEQGHRSSHGRGTGPSPRTAHPKRTDRPVCTGRCIARSGSVHAGGKGRPLTER